MQHLARHELGVCRHARRGWSSLASPVALLEEPAVSASPSAKRVGSVWCVALRNCGMPVSCHLARPHVFRRALPGRRCPGEAAASRPRQHPGTMLVAPRSDRVSAYNRAIESRRGFARGEKAACVWSGAFGAGSVFPQLAASRCAVFFGTVGDPNFGPALFFEFRG